jgi:hypothetical protein
MDAHTQTFRRLCRISAFVVVFILFLTATSCSVLTSDSSQGRKTDLARAVEATLNSEKVKTIEAKGTEQSQEIANLNTTTTSQAVQATIDAQASAIAQFSATQIPTTVSSTNIVTPSPAAVEQTSLSFNNWQAFHWVKLSTGCNLPDIICWKVADDFKTLNGDTDAFLTSQDGIMVEESWTSPYLVFWNKRDLKYDGNLFLIVDGQKINVQIFTKGAVPLWKQESFDLSKYKGKQVQVQFYCPVGMRYIDMWFIQDVKIVPDFEPHK